MTYGEALARPDSVAHTHAHKPNGDGSATGRRKRNTKKIVFLKIRFYMSNFIFGF